MNRSLLISLVLTLIFTGCTKNEYNLFQNDVPGQKEVTVVDKETYKKEISFENIIAPNDRVAITVYVQAGEGSQQMTSILTSRDSNNNTTVQENIGMLVTKKGTTRLPLLGSIHLAGLTQDEASDLLIQEYKKYIRNPYVVVEIKNQRVIVLGEVASPGVVPVTNGTMNVLEALARTGDFRASASRTNLKVIRGDLRNPETRTIDLTKMSAIKVSSLYLKPNDILYVQPTTMTGYNRTFNEVVPFFSMLSTILGVTSNSTSINVLNTAE